MIRGKPPRRPWDLPGWAFAALALGLPWILFAIHHPLGHQGDLRFFFDWYRAFEASPAFYRDGPGINYPVLGVFLVCLPTWLVERLAGVDLDLEGFRLVVKITLVLAETGLVLALAGPARWLRLSRPRLLAVGIYLLPATWAGGAWFGQVDVAGTLFLVLGAWGGMRLASGGGLRWLALGLTGLHGAILTKQLTLFSVPWVAGMLVLALATRWKDPEARRARLAAGLAVVSVLVWFLPDLFLDLPDGRFSHLAFVLLGGGSAHGDVLSGNGANLWALVSPDPSASSLLPVAAGLSAKAWGIILFGITQAGLIGWLALESRRLLREERDPREKLRDAMSALVLTVGVSNLAMATLLTGVHERYLVHGVPFLLLGLQARAVPECPWCRVMIVAAWFVCGWSGLFVLSSIHWESFTGVLAPFRSHTVTGVLELALLAAAGAYLVLVRGGGEPRSVPAPG